MANLRSYTSCHQIANPPDLRPLPSQHPLSQGIFGGAESHEPIKAFKAAACLAHRGRFLSVGCGRVPPSVRRQVLQGSIHSTRSLQERLWRSLNTFLVKSLQPKQSTNPLSVTVHEFGQPFSPCLSIGTLCGWTQSELTGLELAAPFAIPIPFPKGPGMDCSNRVAGATRPKRASALRIYPLPNFSYRYWSFE